ncbi:MAG: glycosyltransferase family 4 protein [Candidatus Promineifilaceae bacterium]|nr:glycosyltransferase family 4 protein [Candidatus Promineifilaceae bacterium]
MQAASSDVELKMRLCYLLLSPTFGMHQYTADLANRMAPGRDVHLVTTAQAPRDRYRPAVTIHTPLTAGDTGLSAGGVHLGALRRVGEALRRLEPDVVHVTGPHLWNVPLVVWLRRRDIPVIHTIHDLDPHSGVGYGRLLHVWNDCILRTADHILVHGERYRHRLLARGMLPGRVTYTPLLHLFLSYKEEVALRREALRREALQQEALRREGFQGGTTRPGGGAGEAETVVLFFGRIRAYKGVGTLLAAWERLPEPPAGARLVLAGQGELPAARRGRLPPGVERRNRRVGGAEAVALFRSCDLVALPYVDATQSALAAAAYFFGKPVLATRSGALPEYVQDGRTGYLVAPGDVEALARTLGEALAQREQLEQMGQAGRAWYERAHRRERATLEALYQDVFRVREFRATV